VHGSSCGERDADRSVDRRDHHRDEGRRRDHPVRRDEDRRRDHPVRRDEGRSRDDHRGHRAHRDEGHLDASPDAHPDHQGHLDASPDAHPDHQGHLDASPDAHRDHRDHRDEQSRAVAESVFHSATTDAEAAESDDLRQVQDPGHQRAQASRSGAPAEPVEEAVRQGGASHRESDDPTKSRVRRRRAAEPAR
jgi:hypothetical protein